jgi:transposase|tara:strand:- start:596 stop:892 length:297 start_codon:yes stop_codon:yes gene_type:complete
MTKRNTYTKEFKLEAVRLLESGDKSGADIARELGIRRNMLYKWQEQLSDKGGNAFRGPGRKPINKDDQVVQLERENQKLKEEVEILKKAAAYFARELK